MASGPAKNESMVGGRAPRRRRVWQRAAAGLGLVVAAGLVTSADLSPADDEGILTAQTAASSPEVEQTTTVASASPATTEAPATTTAPPPETTTTTPPPETTTTTEPPAPATTTTEAPATTTTAPPPANEPLQQGDAGPEVQALQEQLVELGYWLGEADGTYGHTTQQAVMAFQKNEGIGRDGVAGEETQAQLETATRPTGRSTEGTVIEVDLGRQLMLIVENGQVVHALNTSTGAPGWSTPPGEFVIDREIDGWRHAPLGTLYRPKYFNGGIALHGSGSIPGHPASHGCSRLSNPAVDMLWASGLAEIGTRVSVY